MTIEEFMNERETCGVIHLYDDKVESISDSYLNNRDVSYGSTFYSLAIDDIFKYTDKMTVAYKFNGDLKDKKATINAMKENNPEYNLELSFAFCHEKDKFTKSIGREVAINRIIGENPVKFIVPLSVFYDVINVEYMRGLENLDIFTKYFSCVTREDFYNVIFDFSDGDNKKFIVREHFLFYLIYYMLNFCPVKENDVWCDCFTHYRHCILKENGFEKIEVPFEAIEYMMMPNFSLMEENRYRINRLPKDKIKFEYDNRKVIHKNTEQDASPAPTQKERTISTVANDAEKNIVSRMFLDFLGKEELGCDLVKVHIKDKLTEQEYDYCLENGTNGKDVSVFFVSEEGKTKHLSDKLFQQDYSIDVNMETYKINGERLDKVCTVTMSKYKDKYNYAKTYSLVR